MSRREVTQKHNIRTGSSLERIQFNVNSATKTLILTPSLEMANEELLKRRKVNSKRKLNGEKCSKGAVVLWKPQQHWSSRDIHMIKLHLENWVLRLLNKLLFWDLGLVSLCFVEDNVRLQENNARLKKENHFLSRRMKIAYLDQYEIERRLKKFPWLPRNSNAYITYVESTRSSVGNFEWDKLPSDVAVYITEFLSIDELFDLRGLSSLFYEIFYSLDYVSDCWRVIWLSKRGRKFTKLLDMGSEYTCKTFTQDDFQAVNASNFPKLEELCLNDYSNLRFVQSLPNLRGLEITLKEVDDLRYISDVNFPALEALICCNDYLETSQGQNHNCVQYFSGHKNLTKFTFCSWSWRSSWEEIRELNKARFPQLRTVGVVETDYATAAEVLEYLQHQDIKFTRNYSECWINQGDPESDIESQVSCLN